MRKEKSRSVNASAVPRVAALQLGRDSIATVGLDLLHDVDNLGVQLVRGLQAAHLDGDILGAVLSHDLGELLALLIALDVLEAESHLGGEEQSLNTVALLSELNSRGDETLLAAELSERGTANTLNGISQVRVADTLDDLLLVLLLLLGRDAVLLHDQFAGLSKSGRDLILDLLVKEGIVDGLLLAVVTVVGSGGVTSVDGEELALNVGQQVVDPLDTLDGGVLTALEGGAVDNPLVELLQGDIETGVGILSRDNSVNSRVGVGSTLVVVVKAVLRGILGVLDVFSKGVCGANGVLAGNDGERLEIIRSLVDTLGDDGGDEL